MKNALIAFVILGIAAAFSPPAKADDDYDQHYEWHHHHYRHHYMTPITVARAIWASSH
jgi:hypothetical protein